MVQLNELLVPENIVLVDGSIGKRINHLPDLSLIKTFDNINPNGLKGELADREKFLRLMKHPSSVTLAEVTEEYSQYKISVSSHVQRISENTHRDNNVSEKKKEWRTGIGLLLGALNDALYETEQVMTKKEARKIIKIDEQKYNSLVEMTRLVAIKEDLKTKLSYGPNEDPYDSDTDEKLCAMLFYLSMYSPKKPILLVKDHHFTKITSEAPGILGAEVFTPYNEHFREALYWNPFELYFLKESGEFEPKVKSSMLKYNSCSISEKNKWEESKIKQSLALGWLKFNGKHRGSIS